MAAFTVANLVTIVATVFTLTATGAVIGRLMKVSDRDGDRERLSFRPRRHRRRRDPGGAITVTAVLVVLRWVV